MSQVAKQQVVQKQARPASGTTIVVVDDPELKPERVQIAIVFMPGVNRLQPGTILNRALQALQALG